MVRRPLLLVSLAVAYAALAALAYVASVHAGITQRLDVRVLEGFMGVRGPRTEPVATALAGLFDPAPYAALCLLPAAIALLRGRWTYGLAAAVALLGANLTTQYLKATVLSPRPSPAGVQLGDQAWPSGHTTAAMTLALALVLVSPARLRPLVAALGGLVTAAVVYAILILGWHYPSDVAGGFFVATGWFCLTLAGLKAAERGAATHLRLWPAMWPAVLAGVLGTAAFAALAALEWERVSGYVRDHTTFVAGAAVLAAVAVVLAGIVAGAVSASGRAPRGRRATGR